MWKKNKKSITLINIQFKIALKNLSTWIQHITVIYYDNHDKIDLSQLYENGLLENMQLLFTIISDLKRKN